MHVVEQSEFPIYEGQHEAIISEEDWQLAQEKRKTNGYKREKIHDLNHAHILSGLLKCPCCGKSLYGNIAKAHSKDKKTRYYYYCKNTTGATGHKCTFRLNIEQTELNEMVAKIISAMVKDRRFSEAIQERDCGGHNRFGKTVGSVTGAAAAGHRDEESAGTANGHLGCERPVL
jgi:site-specific DNA recombinase